MQIKNDKQYKHYKKHHIYLGTILEKGVPVDLYYDSEQRSYLGRYGSERDNYTVMSETLAARPSMVTHVLFNAHRARVKARI